MQTKDAISCVQKEHRAALSSSYEVVLVGTVLIRIDAARPVLVARVVDKDKVHSLDLLVVEADLDWPDELSNLTGYATGGPCKHNRVPFLMLASHLGVHEALVRFVPRRDDHHAVSSGRQRQR